MQQPVMISEIEAITRFHLDTVLERYTSKYVSPQKACNVWLHEGDMEIDGNLIVDWSENWPTDVVGMIVTGNLTVKDSILNRNINDGPFLLVLGNVKANNLLGGGSEIHIARSAMIRDLCVGEYNDGILTIKGTLECKLLIVDDHFTDIGKKKCHEWTSDMPPSVSELKLSDYLSDEINIQTETEPYERETVDVYEEIVPRLVQGLPVLRTKGARRKGKAYQDWLFELREHPDRLEKAPQELHTPELVMLSVTNYGGWLQHASAKSRSREVCLAAVSNSGRALEFVPESFKDEQLCKAAVTTDGCALAFVPASLMSEELCRIAVGSEGGALYAVPPELRTMEICLAAVRSNGDALVLVPEALRTKELCLEAMHHVNTCSVEAIPRESLTEEMCVAAVSKHGGGLKEVPVDLRTPRVCLAAVNNDGHALEYVPIDSRNAEIVRAAIVSSPDIVIDLHREGVLTEDLCMVAAEKWGLVLMHIPHRFLTVRVCIAAVKDCDDAMEYVPTHLREMVKAGSR